MKYTVFIENGYDGLDYLGEFTREQLEDFSVIKSMVHPSVSKGDLTIVAGEIVELW